jgi:hypothetical protein
MSKRLRALFASPYKCNRKSYTHKSGFQRLLARRKRDELYPRSDDLGGKGETGNETAAAEGTPSNNSLSLPGPSQDHHGHMGSTHNSTQPVVHNSTQPVVKQEPAVKTEPPQPPWDPRADEATTKEEEKTLQQSVGRARENPEGRLSKSSLSDENQRRNDRVDRADNKKKRPKKGNLLALDY